MHGQASSRVRQQRRTERLWSTPAAQNAEKATSNATFADETSGQHSPNCSSSGTDDTQWFNAGSAAHPPAHVKCVTYAPQLEYDDERRSSQPASNPHQPDIHGLKHVRQPTNFNDSDDFYSSSAP